MSVIQTPVSIPPAAEHAVQRRPAPAPVRVAQAFAAPGRWQAVFVGFAFIVYLGARFTLNSGEPTVSTGESDLSYTISQAVLTFGSGLLLLRYYKRCVPWLIPLSPFLMLLALAMFSTFWSQAPESSFRRSLSLTTMLVFVLYAQGVFGALQVCRIQIAATWVIAAASLAVAIVFPTSGFDIESYAGAIRGVFNQKNSLGEAMSTSVLALSYIVMTRRRVLWRDGAHVAMALTMTVLSQSTTALVLSLLVIGATGMALMLARGGVVAGLGLLAGVLLVVALMGILLVSPDLILNALGKDSTLTGRARIWAGIGHAVGPWPLLGYGYSAFWLPTSLPARTIWAEITWQTPTAHSGYLDTMLELGTLGLTVVAVLVALTVARAVWALRSGRWPEACWALIVLLVTGLFNYDESSLPRPDIHQLQWVLALLALAAPAVMRPKAATGWQRRVSWAAQLPPRR